MTVHSAVTQPELPEGRTMGGHSLLISPLLVSSEREQNTDEVSRNQDRIMTKLTRNEWDLSSTWERTNIQNDMKGNRQAN